MANSAGQIAKLRALSIFYCVGLLVVVGLLCVSACSTIASGELAFTFITVVPEAVIRDERASSVVALTQLVEALTDGQVTLAIEPVGQRCRQAEDCLGKLKTGDIDVYRLTVDELIGLFPELQVLNIPYLIENETVAKRVFSGAFFARMRDALLFRTGLRLMAVSNAGGWRHIANDVHEVQTPEDLTGLILATFDAPVQIETTRALGAVPLTRRRDSDDLSAMVKSQGIRTGVLDLLAEDGKTRPSHITLDRHNYMVALWVMNDQSFGEMPLDLQMIVQLGFDELKRLTLGFSDTRESEALAAFEAAGGHVYVPTREQHRSFVMAAGRVSTWFMDEYGYEWLVWFEGAIAEAEREIELVR